MATPTRTINGNQQQYWDATKGWVNGTPPAQQSTLKSAPAPAPNPAPASNSGIPGMPANPWAGKSAGQYGDTSQWYNWVNQHVGQYVNINGQPFLVQNTPDAEKALSNAQAGGQLTPNTYLPSAPPSVPTPTTTPEQNALSEVQKTDPATAQSVQNLATYFNNVSNQVADPTIQNALNTYMKQQAATTQPQADSLNSYYTGIANALKSGNVLDPTAINQIEQASRAAQESRGNALGTAQASQEALNTGQAGIQLGQQEAGMLNNYIQGNAANAQTYLNNQVGGTQSYINSGTTPIAIGSRQLSDIINQANSANNATPFQSTYNPASTYTYTNPSSGAQFAQGANNWYNSANQQYLGTGGGGGGAAGAAIGAGTGALSGAAAGTAAYPGIGTAIGALIGAAAGGLSGSR